MLHPTAIANAPRLSACALVLAVLMLTACGGGDEPSRLDRLFTGDQAELYPARPDAPHADSLTECAKIFNRGGNNQHNFCTLAQLPLLGQEQTVLAVEDVLARTLISHDWMAERFEQALTAMPDDLLQMFQGVTAIVIGADIRPSYYWLATGSIYLDPSRLWLTIEERDTISRAPDFRSDFDQDLSFDNFWRYVKDGRRAWTNPPLSGPGQPRTVDDILAPMASLLFHELAHANDYIPPNVWANLDPTLTPNQAAVRHQDDTVSATLHSTYPLHSELMMDLAEVMFSGRDASVSEQSLDAETVSLEFRTDSATDPYSYVTSTRQLFLEDTAMMFEEAMMQYHFGVTRELAFADRPETDNPDCNEFIVRWGQRGRVGDDSIQPRLALVLARLLDQNEVQPYLDRLPSPEAMASGVGWCASLSSAPLGVHGEAGSGILAPTEPVPEGDRHHSGGHPHHSGSQPHHGHH